MDPSLKCTSFLLLLLSCLSAVVASAGSNRQHGRRRGVVGVVGHSAEIPCEITPSTPGDAPNLILWYKEVFGTPIYRYVPAHNKINAHNDFPSHHIFGNWLSIFTNLDFVINITFDNVGETTKLHVHMFLLLRCILGTSIVVLR